MSLKNLYTYTLLILFLGVEFYFAGGFGVGIAAASLLFYALITYLIYIAWKKHKRDNIMFFNDFFHLFLFKVLTFILILVSLIGGFIYYNNEISPAPMPEIRLSNGDKTVVFQAMIHIGTQDFYDKVKKHITANKKAGYVYYYEGVKSGNKEDLEKFNTAIGIKFDKDLYKNFAKLYGVVEQDNDSFLGLYNKQDYNVDMKLSDIIEEYEKRPENGKRTGLPIDASKEILEQLDKLDDRELSAIVYLNQGILNFLVKNDTIKDIMTKYIGDPHLMDIIIHGRNKVVAEEIINSQHQKIYATYGLLHFEGIFELLKQNDPNWKIIGRKDFYPIQ